MRPKKSPPGKPISGARIKQPRTIRLSIGRFDLERAIQRSIRTGKGAFIILRAEQSSQRSAATLRQAKPRLHHLRFQRPQPPWIRDAILQ